MTFDMVNFLKLSVHVFCLAEKQNFAEKIAEQTASRTKNVCPCRGTSASLPFHTALQSRESPILPILPIH